MKRLAQTRRRFLQNAAVLSTAAVMGPLPRLFVGGEDLFKISLAQWSLHRTLRSGALEALDFPAFSKERFGIDAVEYVNQFFNDKATDFVWLGELKDRAEDHGVKSLLIMIDGEGALADPDSTGRAKAVENHYKWVAAAAFLGCHSIRVNAAGSGTEEEQRDRAADSLRRLASFAAPYGISVLVENHGGLSSNGAWLASVMKAADHAGVGTLPDFGNFRISGDDWYDRYLGVTQLMPFARAVSAKSHDFDEEGNETRTDFRRMLGIVTDLGYRGYVGIEYEGSNLGEEEGILATQALLKRVRKTLSR